MIDPDLLLALGGQHGTNADVLDVRTGRTVVRMTGWTPVRDPVVGHGRLVVRPDPDKPESGWFAMIDPQYGAPAPLGELSGVTFQDCQTTADLLACLTVHNTLRVWRFRQ